jgi:proteasome assembly chaperone (PAC2) family protein
MFGVKRIYFVGSVAGLVPHTREPRLHCSVSDSDMKHYLEQLGFNFTNYEGPGSIVTKLIVESRRRNKQMAVMVAAVPAYVQGNNPKALEAVIRRLRKILGIQIDINELAQLGEAFQEKIQEVVNNEPELAENIRKLEENYDNEVFDEDMGDLKQWLKDKGVKVD